MDVATFFQSAQIFKGILGNKMQEAEILQNNNLRLKQVLNLKESMILI